MNKDFFKVGKKYRYTGKGDTDFSINGNMDYLKTGGHKIKDVEDTNLVLFEDDPHNKAWWVDPVDFEEVYKKEYYVYNPKTTHTKVKHPTIELAKREAERLSRNTGDIFEVLMVVAKCKATTTIEWE